MAAGDKPNADFVRVTGHAERAQLGKIKRVGRFSIGAAGEHARGVFGDFLGNVDVRHRDGVPVVIKIWLQAVALLVNAVQVQAIFDAVIHKGVFTEEIHVVMRRRPEDLDEANAQIRGVADVAGRVPHDQIRVKPGVAFAQQVMQFHVGNHLIAVGLAERTEITNINCRMPLSKK